MQPLYSICITCRNNFQTVRSSLDSIFNQIDGRFEVVVVDAKSNDGTLQILQEYLEKNFLKLIVKKCSVGAGRQIAFKNSVGKYIIANMDMDDIFQPTLIDLLNFYHKHCEGKVLLAINNPDQKLRALQNITIGERNLIERLGGWRDLRWAEDWDLLSRAAKNGAYLWTVFPVVNLSNLHLERQILKTKLMFRYVKYRELFRLGRPIFNEKEKPNFSQMLILFLAKLTSHLEEDLRDNFNKTFNTYDPKYYI